MTGSGGFSKNSHNMLARIEHAMMIRTILPGFSIFFPSQASIYPFPSVLVTGQFFVSLALCRHEVQSPLPRLYTSELI